MANCKELHPDIDGQETQAYKDCVAKKKAEEKLLAEGLKTAKPQVIELDEVVVEDKLGGSIKPLKIPKTNAEGLEIIVLPPAKAAAICPIVIAKGKFHGLMHKTVPFGPYSKILSSPVGPLWETGCKFMACRE